MKKLGFIIRINLLNSLCSYFFIVNLGFESLVFSGALQSDKNSDDYLKAQNNYYLELKKLPHPSDQEIQDLKVKILETARKNFIQSVEDDKKQQKNEERAESEKHDRAFQGSLLKKIDQNSDLKTDADRQKVKKVMKDALRGDFKEVNLMRKALKNLPAEKGKTLAKGPKTTVPEVGQEPQKDPSDAQPISLEGSKTLNVIEFSGPQKKDKKPQPKK